MLYGADQPTVRLAMHGIEHESVVGYEGRVQ